MRITTTSLLSLSLLTPLMGCDDESTAPEPSQSLVNVAASAGNFTILVDALEATRAYEANIGVMEVSKNLGQQTLRILA